jgi:hypothetical protein
VKRNRSTRESDAQVRDLRRAFRSKEQRSLFDQCIEHGWKATMLGSGHVRLLPPDDSREVVTLSVSDTGTGRQVLNAAAPLKRWLKEKA